jgi:energy-coupling factor transporter ATP-binding protein EcfA2
VAPELLQIKQLSSTGELLGVVSCHAGQISVFRAASASDLAPYLRALAGISGQERFSISLDDEVFIPTEHNLIGFGERFTSGGDAETPQQVLFAVGAPEGSIPAALASVGLEGVMSRPCSSLTACEERRLRILAATFQPSKVLVLNDPFDPLSSQWKERFAESLSAFVRAKNALVVVPFLSNRPESWIDNERVARIQVGQSVQKTIGFGSGPSQIRGVIDQIRGEHSTQGVAASGEETPAVEEESLSRPSQLDDLMDESRREREAGSKGRLPLMLGAFVLLVAIGVGAGMVLLPQAAPKNSELASNLTEDGITDEGTSINALSAISEPTLPGKVDNVSQPTAQSPSSAEPVLSEAPASSEQISSAPTRVARLLDLYPEAIRASIIESFEGLVNSDADLTAQSSPRLSRDQAAAPSAKRPSGGNASEILTVLESTSSETPVGPDASAQSSPSEQELESMSSEQRREVIRQRFLEAIQRAAHPQ